MQGGRKAKWIPMLLAVIGSIAVTAGLFVAVLTMTRTSADDPDIRPADTVYVGANACFTCHKDRDHNWSQMLNAERITNPVATSQSAVLDVNLRAETASLIVSGVVASENAPIEDWRWNERYVIAMDDGNVVVPQRESVPIPNDCDEDCDASAQTSETLGFDTLDVTCAICHTKHLRLADGHFAIVRAQYG